jgi:hypothetical protein
LLQESLKAHCRGYKNPLPYVLAYLIRSVVYPVTAFLGQNTVPKLNEALARGLEL